MGRVARGSGDSWTMSAAQFDMDRNEFHDERDTARPLFYSVDEIVDVPVMDENGNPKLDPTKPQKNKKGETTFGVLTEEKAVPTEYVRIQCPGESLNVFEGKVREEDKRRWPEAYKRFKQGEEQTAGTPLSKWPALANNIQMQAEFRALGYFCVEDLANMPDGAVHEIHGADMWRKRAKHFVAEKQKTAQMAKDAAAKNETDAKFAALEAQLAQLTALLAQKSTEAPVSQIKERKKPGPKPKNPTSEAPAAA